MLDDIYDMFVSAYRIPTDSVESDGTLEWNSTTLVIVEIKTTGYSGIGYTYGDMSVATFIGENLKSLVLGQNPLDIGKINQAMAVAIRNQGHCGLAYMALSAVDSALWDLKAKILGLPLCRLIGMVREDALIYGSGGFTSYSDEQLASQLGNWANEGFSCVKMKIGRRADRDMERIGAARLSVGDSVQLFVDANGAYTVKQSLALADTFREKGITWFEEPVSSDDRPGLRFIRDHAPSSVRIAAGEYGYAPGYFLTMLQTGSVDILQADATRCGGITGFLKVGQLSEVFQTPFSFHCAPSLHLHAALCLNAFYIGEYFHDHVRIENMLFDGAPVPKGGMLRPDLARPGFGIDFKQKDAERYRIR